MRLGVPAGKRVGELLTAVQNLQLEGVLQTSDDAIEWVKSQL